MNGRDRKTLLLTGAAGFVGASLVRRFVLQGWSVVALTRSRPRLEEPNVTWQPYDLQDDSLPEEVFNNADAFVHAAVATEYGGNNFRINLDSSRKLFAMARACAIPRRVFISSLAARADATSGYGKGKFLVEQILDATEEAVVRPGLVIGNGGLFARMVAFLRRSPLVPVFGDGRQPVQTVDLDDLTTAIFQIVDRQLHGTFAIALEPIPYIDLYLLLCEQLGLKRRFVHVSFATAEFGAKVASVLRLGLPVSLDSILGLKQMRAYDTSADPRRLALSLRSVQESIERTLAGTASQERPS